MKFNQIKKINVKQKITSNTIMFLVISVSVIYFAVYLASQDIKNQRAEIITEKIEIEKMINREQNMSNLAIKLKKIENDLDKISKAFIDKNGQLEFITTLENIASYNNVTQNINLLPSSADNQKFTKSIINIMAKGTYIDVVNYIRDIESLSYYVNITYLSISRTPSQGIVDEDNQVNLTLSAETFWK